MQAIEIETTIDADGTIQLPEAYRDRFGRAARLVVLFSEPAEPAALRPAPGSAKGRLVPAQDDDEHLADFTDYMK